jgi:hypothetical protein
MLTNANKSYLHKTSLSYHVVVVIVVNYVKDASVALGLELLLELEHALCELAARLLLLLQKIAQSMRLLLPVRDLSV